MKELTKAEEEIMQVLWDMKKAFVKEVVERMPEPKPAYNTVSTIIRILQEKDFVSHEAVGKSHLYYPLVTKEDYSKYKMDRLVSGYFEGSLGKMLSFFVDRKKLNTRELDEIIGIIEKNRES